MTVIRNSKHNDITANVRNVSQKKKKADHDGPLSLTSANGYEGDVTDTLNCHLARILVCSRSVVYFIFPDPM